MNEQRLLERFLRYVHIDTTANPRATSYPSSPGQLALGALLVEELLAAGIADAHQDEHGLVWGTVPATVPGEQPVIALNAHLDTSPETTGAGVRPQVIRQYAGGDIPLPGAPSQIIRVADNADLPLLLGRTLVTSDGTTLLGGDDKAGVAVIMEVVSQLMERAEIPHGPVRVLFTCDEEIGHGVDHVDLARLGATAAYTLDGPGAQHIDVETFSADLATITIRGVNIHPSIAKNRMVNAVRAAAEFLTRLPQDRLCPEQTDGRDGFLHPYQVEGGVAEVVLRVLLRDFETHRLHEQAELLRKIAAEVEGRIPGSTLQVETRAQYRNMREGLRREPRAVRCAELACQRLGYLPRLSIIRGGTDGSQLTERGLPTPNLSTGQHTPHSPLEWVCLEEMTQAAQTLVELLKIWCESAD
jgi:tripeptide aminopeptidase